MIGGLAEMRWFITTRNLNAAKSLATKSPTANEVMCISRYCFKYFLVLRMQNPMSFGGTLMYKLLQFTWSEKPWDLHR